jgi:hypothetical protein
MAMRLAITAPMPPPMAMPATIITKPPKDGAARTSVVATAMVMPIMP